jgi:hypothetical protein
MCRSRRDRPSSVYDGRRSFMLDQEKLLELIAEDRKRREADMKPLDGDLSGSLTFSRAQEVALNPSSMTEREQKLVASSPRAARLIEDFLQLLRSGPDHEVKRTVEASAVSRSRANGAAEAPLTPAREEVAAPRK